MNVVWLDLANAYGSVPHRIIDFAMEHFWEPGRLRDIVGKYYQKFKMRFPTRNFTTDWQSLDVGVPMGCAKSPLLFVLVMEMVIREAEHCCTTTHESIYGCYHYLFTITRGCQECSRVVAGVNSKVQDDDQTKQEPSPLSKAW